MKIFVLKIRSLKTGFCGLSVRVLEKSFEFAKGLDVETMHNVRMGKSLSFAFDLDLNELD